MTSTSLKFSSIMHGDMVHDIAFDFYGRRLATCSSDQQIKICDIDEESGEPHESAKIENAHQAAIWRLSWAHPEFGQLIASCSHDTSVHIWEEQESVTIRDKERRWQKKAQLSDSKCSVRDVKFAPRHLGLKLATASADGFVRIYEATDVFTLNYWPLQDSFQVEKVTGSDRDSDLGLRCLSWNDSPFENAKLVVGGYSRKAAIWTCDNSGAWRMEVALGEHSAAVSDVAWAPNMGRSYHLIASADTSSTFKIHTIDRRENGVLELTSTQDLCVDQDVGEPLPGGGRRASSVWRVAWNATGTVLSTSSDSAVDLWRRNFEGVWERCQSMGTAHADGQL
jgi:nucleoporin SEH1